MTNLPNPTYTPMMEKREMKQLNKRLDAALTGMTALEDKMPAARVIRLVLPESLSKTTMAELGIHDPEQVNGRQAAAIALAHMLGITWNEEYLDAATIDEMESDTLFALQVNILENMPDLILSLSVEKQMALDIVGYLDSQFPEVQANALELLKSLGFKFTWEAGDFDTQTLANLDEEVLFSMQLGILHKLPDIDIPRPEPEEMESELARRLRKLDATEAQEYKSSSPKIEIERTMPDDHDKSPASKTFLSSLETLRTLEPDHRIEVSEAITLLLCAANVALETAAAARDALSHQLESLDSKSDIIANLALDSAVVMLSEASGEVTRVSAAVNTYYGY